LQAQIEASSLSHPVWRTILPVLDSTCSLDLSGFNPDTVFYDLSEQTFVGIVQCGTSRVLAKSKDFAEWRTVISLNQLVPADSQNISVRKASDGSLLMKWRQPNGNWLATFAYPGRSPAPVISGAHTRDLIDVWSSMPVGLTLDQGSMALWGYHGDSGSWNQLGTSVGQRCVSFRVASGSLGHVTGVCWIAGADGLSTRRAAIGFSTRDGGMTWSAF
jgi:hypothetical protein